MRDSLRVQRLFALALAAALLLNFPLLTLWDVDAMVLGLPLLPLAVFAGWAGVIALAAWVVEGGDDEGGPPP